MLKILLISLFIFFNITVIANDKVEIYASSIETNNNIVEASSGVTVVYKDYYLSASRAKYNQKNGELELFDNIRANYKQNFRILGDYAKLNIEKKEKIFKPFYMLEKVTDVWISAKSSSALAKDINITSGVVSGCNQNNPLWKMEFTSSDFDYESKWLNLYNSTLYIYDIPVFYLPYIGYSLDRRRKTGLLMPAIAISDKEGFYYQQPLYIAEYDSWDLEIRPQIRTNRGKGVYSDFRFVDSFVSKGKLSLGYFKEYNKYFLENQLVNSSHYGFNFTYENRDVANEWGKLDLKGQSALYIDINNMNDVDYINLASTSTLETNTATQVISRTNAFYNNDDNYVGMYLKYYKDLEKDSNAQTLQNLPSVQYHSYLDTLLDDHFLYNLDIKANNFHRDEGQGAVQTDLNIPLQLQTSLLDEYMNVSYTSYVYGQNTSFNGEDKQTPPTDVEGGTFLRNYHVFNASSQLTRAYDDMTHVVNFGSQYIFAGQESKDGFYENEENYCSDKKTNGSKPDYASRCEFYNVSDVEENVQLYFSQYIYDSAGKQIIYHRLAQSFVYGTPHNELGEIENELDYQISDNINFYNNMFYSHYKAAFSKNFNKITYSDETINLGLSYMYQENFALAPSVVGKYTRYITSSLTYKYNNHYSYNFITDYDMEIRKKKTTSVGFLYQKRCWDFGLKYVENNRPTLDSNGKASSQYERFIYFTVALKPVMKSGAEAGQFIYKLPEKDKDNN